MYEYENGDRLQDIITGFKGICVGRCDYLTGCAQYLLQPVDKENTKKLGGEWFDSNRLKLVKAKAVKIDTSKYNGPDMAAPIK